MQPSYSTLTTSWLGEHVVLLTLNRPSVCHAINSVMMTELKSFWMEVSEWGARCIILTGAGERAFCAGADLKERHDLDEKTWKQHHAMLQASMLAMNACSVPIIAAVNGAAFGGGFELALSADFIYASSTARFALPEVKLGIMPGAMGTQHLPAAAGLRRAKELVLTGQAITAQQAHDWQIINAIFPPEALLEQAQKTAQLIAMNAPLSVSHAKAAMNHAGQRELESGYNEEVSHYNQLLPTKDRLEGIAAFNEKRPPQFTGE